MIICNDMHVNNNKKKIALVRTICNGEILSISHTWSVFRSFPWCHFANYLISLISAIIGLLSGVISLTVVGVLICLSLFIFYCFFFVSFIHLFECHYHYHVCFHYWRRFALPNGQNCSGFISFVWLLSLFSFPLFLFRSTLLLTYAFL